MKEAVEFILRRTARKTLQIEVDGTGRVIVRAPARLSERRIESFVAEKREFIERAQQKVAENKFVSAEDEAYFFGKLCKIEIGEPRFEGGRLFLRERTADALKALYKSELSKWLARTLPAVSAKNGFSYCGAKVTSAEKRFGSCSGKNSLSFSYRLCAYPEGAIYYVVCHELCHTTEKNHGAGFWREVKRVCPDYKEWERELRKVYK